VAPYPQVTSLLCSAPHQPTVRRLVVRQTSGTVKVVLFPRYLCPCNDLQDGVSWFHETMLSQGTGYPPKFDPPCRIVPGALQQWLF
jgi:hypothetical protein